MNNTVFFSWQSDLAETRNVVQAALLRAIRGLNRNLALEEALRLDEDTSGVAGWPEITSTILDKIERCELLVADITPINGPQSDLRLTPNPNVLFELGYALATGMGRTRIICVVNAAYLPGGDPKELPFDVRGSRPLKFFLEDPASRGATKGQEDPVRTSVREDLAKSLESALGETLDAIHTERESTILSVIPHLATDNLERFQVLFNVQTSVPFQVNYRIQEPEPYKKILSGLMMASHPIDPKENRMIRFPAESLKPRSPGNDTYVLWGKIGHVATDASPVPVMHEFEVHYRAIGNTLVEIHRHQPPPINPIVSSAMHVVRLPVAILQNTCHTPPLSGLSSHRKSLENASRTAFSRAG